VIFREGVARLAGLTPETMISRAMTGRGESMQRYAWTLIVPMFLGCAGKNVVSGDDKTNAEKLAADLPSWCEQTCQRLEVCDNPDVCDCQGDVCECKGVGDDCVNDCQDGLNKFAQSDSCAETGRAYLTCLDSLGCELLAAGSKPPCLPPESQLDACRDDEDDETPTAPTGPNGSGGTSGTGDGPSEGGAYSGPVPGAAAAPSVGQAVSCNDSGGSGGGAPNAGSGPYVTCQESHSDCSDSHEYSWICVNDAQGHGWCTCFLDGDPVGALDPELICPSRAEVNAACSWNLQGF
jgi:hypothetical protein